MKIFPLLFDRPCKATLFVYILLGSMDELNESVQQQLQSILWFTINVGNLENTYRRLAQSITKKTYVFKSCVNT